MGVCSIKTMLRCNCDVMNACVCGVCMSVCMWCVYVGDDPSGFPEEEQCHDGGDHHSSHLLCSTGSR